MTTAYIINGRIKSPETGVGVVGGAGEIVSRGDVGLSGTSTVSDDDRGGGALGVWSVSRSSTCGIGGGSSDSGDVTVVVAVMFVTVLLESAVGIGLEASSSSSAECFPKDPALGVFSSKISSASLSLMGGNRESPSTRKFIRGRW